MVPPFRLLAGLLAGLAPIAVLAAPLQPDLKQEHARCMKQIGAEAPVEAAADYREGLSASAMGLTPAQLRGVTTISPRVAGCLLDAMGDAVLPVQVVGDSEGVPDALVLPIGGTRNPSETEMENMLSMLGIVAGSKDRPLLVYCHHTSCFLSYNAALRLRDAGYTRIFWMREGISGWKKAGLKLGLVRKNGNRQRPETPIRKRSPIIPDGYPLPPHFYDRSRWEPLRAATGLRYDRLCLAVGQHMPAKDEGAQAGLKYYYQELLYKAAGIDPGRDDVVQIGKKMRAFWAQYGDRLECAASSVMGSYSVIKLAMDRDNDAFVNDVVRNWKVPLNKVDYSDGMTALDFAEYLHNRLQIDGNSRYENMFRAIRENGGLYREELEAKGDWPKPDVLQADVIRQHVALAEKDDRLSMWYLFTAHRRGYHTPLDRAESDRWLERLKEYAVRKRDGATMEDIANLYRDDRIRKAEIVNDDAEALRWSRLSAAAGDPRGMRSVGRAYLFGHNVPKNLQTALDLLKKSWAIDQNRWVRGDIGIAYDELGDYDTAALWLRGLPQGLDLAADLTVEQWFKLHGLSPCGPTHDGGQTCR
jgi:rhodanese-related sulfurtransferase